MQKVEPLVREELGLKSVDEEYVHKLLNEHVRKEINSVQDDRANQTYNHEQNQKILAGACHARKLSQEEEKTTPKGRNTVQSIRPSRVMRKLASSGKKGSNHDLTPIGRSKTITGMQKTQEDQWHEDLINNDLYKIDLDQINTSIRTLFLTTLKFNDELIKDMISGLGELIVNSVEELSTQTTLGSGKGTLAAHMNPKQKKNLFSLRKMTEIALVNIYRVEHFWQIIIDQLMVISV